MAKKDNTQWMITEDGRKVATASTKASADALLRAMTKKLPLGMSFNFKVEERQCTTNN